MRSYSASVDTMRSELLESSATTRTLRRSGSDSPAGLPAVSDSAGSEPAAAPPPPFSSAVAGALTTAGSSLGATALSTETLRPSPVR